MIEEPQSPRKQSIEASQTSLRAAAIGQSSLGSYGVWVCLPRAPSRARQNSVLTVLFTTIK